jgi:uncharacterized membrane protein YidH (DUF202 family)
MKLVRQFYVRTIITALTLVPAAAQAYANDTSLSNLHADLTKNSITVDPGVMLIVGFALIALRVLFSRRSKRRDKEPIHS